MPRRYSTYPQELAQGTWFAQVSLLFIVLLLAGILLYLWDTGRRCANGAELRSPRHRGDLAAVARRHGLDGAPGWTFGVTSPEEIEELARAIGFWSEWDEARAQFDHPAMLAAIDRGVVVRLVVGARVPVWLVERELVPGRTWQAAIEEIIETVPASEDTLACRGMGCSGA